MAQAHVSQVVLGRTRISKDFKLIHGSSSTLRRKKRRRFKREYQQKLRLDDDTRTNVAYGDSRICDTYRGNTPVPVKVIQQQLIQHAIVMPVNEFDTTVTCCRCERRLSNVTFLLNTSSHKKKLRMSAPEKEAIFCI